MSRERLLIAAYIMASERNGTLYVGVTSSLYYRVWQHKSGRFEGFSKQYGCTRLVWFERFERVTNAIHREKQLKRYLRRWKLNLIRPTIQSGAICRTISSRIGSRLRRS